MSQELQFADLMISEDGRYSIGVERSSGRHFISVQLSEGFVEYDEHYELSEAEFEILLVDPAAGEAFARRCQAGEEDGRMFGPGGSRPS